MPSGDWSGSSTTDLYTNILADLHDRDEDVCLWFEGSSPTNLPTGAKRFNLTTDKFERWNGSSWQEMSNLYVFSAINVTGNLDVGGTLTGFANLDNGSTLTSSPSAGDNSTKIATTAYVKAQGSAGSASPSFTGTASFEDITFSGVLNTTSTSHIELPVGTTAQRPGTPATGMIRWNSTEGSAEAYNGSAWGALGGGGGQVTAWLAATTSGSTPIIEDDYNVTSITDLGVGSFRVNWTETKVANDYACVVSGTYDSQVTALTTTYAQVFFFNTVNGGGLDPPNWSVIVCETA